MKEKLILRFQLPEIEHLKLVTDLCDIGYHKTGNKFQISFNGSKGYLSNIEISCEGYQKASNRIFVDKMTNKNGSFEDVMINVFYSDQNGVRLSAGVDLPQTIVKPKFKAVKKTCAEAGNDLPF